MSGQARRSWHRLCCGLVCGLLLLAGPGCSSVDPLQHADALAAPVGLTRERVATGAFVLTAYARITHPGDALTVYIEGDGPAWVTPSQPSDDPTPHQATGLTLAVADVSDNVVYLARPCQFTPMALNPGCAARYWTGRRFAAEVVASMNQAVDQFAARLPGQPLHLVGYSGGGALAVLIAARRTDVASIRTVAGNLDHEAVNRWHGVSPMPESENPIDFAARVADIPQLHFSGAADRVVPPAIAQRFVAAVGPRCARQQTLAGMAHDSDWARLWPALRTALPRCTP
jgi:hypothetical protein